MQHCGTPHPHLFLTSFSPFQIISCFSRGLAYLHVSKLFPCHTQTFCLSFYPLTRVVYAVAAHRGEDHQGPKSQIMTTGSKNSCISGIWITVLKGRHEFPFTRCSSCPMQRAWLEDSPGKTL